MQVEITTSGLPIPTTFNLIFDLSVLNWIVDVLFTANRMIEAANITFYGFMDLLLFLLKLLVSFIAVILIVSLIKVIFEPEKLIILPFEVPRSEDKYSGKAISDLLLSEIYRIERININKPPSSKIKPEIPLEIMSVISLGPMPIGETHTISNLGTVSAGPISLSLTEAITTIKRYRPGGSDVQSISGSLQKFQSNICLTAYYSGFKEKFLVSTQHLNLDIEQKEFKPLAWSICRKADEDRIPELVRDLSFKIVYDLSTLSPRPDKSINPEQDKSIESKTWQGFKYYTEAFHNYGMYILTGQTNCLGLARDNCIQAMQVEKDYVKLSDLIQHIAVEYYGKKEYNAAERLFQEAINLKLDLKAFIGLSAALNQQGKYNNAIEKCNKAIVLFEKDEKIEEKDISKIWNNKGISLNNLKCYKSALEAFDKSINHDNTLAEPSIGEGFALFKLESYESSLKSYEDAIGKDRQSAQAYIGKATALGKLNRYEEAIKFYDIALEKDRQSAKAYIGKATALGKLNRYEEAIKYCDNALEIDPESTEVRDLKVKILYKLGRNDEANALLIQNIRLNN